MTEVAGKPFPITRALSKVAFVCLRIFWMMPWWLKILTALFGWVGVTMMR